jgi:hypothetical protein
MGCRQEEPASYPMITGGEVDERFCFDHMLLWHKTFHYMALKYEVG